MLIRTLALSAAFSALLAGASAAQDTPFAVDVHAGTTGVGIGARYMVNDMFVLRADYDSLKHSDDFSSDDVNYDGELEFKPFTFAVDVHPFRNSFFVSGGYVTGDREVNLSARADGITDIGGIPFEPEEIGTLRAKADLGDGAPFVGLGFDNTFTSSGNIGFRFLAGAILGDSPSVTMSSDSPFADEPEFQEALEEERRELEADVKDVKTWPVVQLGVNWRF